MTFAETLKKLRIKAGKSRYRLAQYSGINEAYILRLERGERANPSRDVVLMLGLALVEGSDSVCIWDIDELLLSADYSPLRRRGETAGGLDSRCFRDLPPLPYFDLLPFRAPACFLPELG